ncbi:MAG: hypothetical protein HWE33_12485 [Rhodobacteraceae bacterium]|uniref:DUF2946 family protein n=1 Tax=Celeribacter sp. HF31 TaxID=2721558 RepID=UPI0014322DD0|nr:DUF2946 family protein [Celeribacter sp. HF31]NIY80234.1 hypothetical protein [Celeribacter sp. HF31]NVK47113.1 hypothetical protein [Paracoccaceae bacterium]
MVFATLRLFLFLALMLGIVGPKSSALLAQLGLIHTQVIVICTGDGLQTITLDADGNPIEHEDAKSQPCPLCHVTSTVVGMTLDNPYPATHRLADYPKPDEVSGRGAPYVHRFARAPPASLILS